MTTTMAREEYVRICNDIFDLMMDGVSEDAPVMIDLKEAAQQLADEYGIEVPTEEDLEN